MDAQHDLPVVGVEVQQDRGADEVLGEVPQERDRPENTRRTTYTRQHMFRLLTAHRRTVC